MRIVIAVVSCWAAASVGGFWYYDLRYAIPAARPSSVMHVTAGESLRLSDGSQLSIKPNTGWTLLDFTSQECGCSQFIKPHVRELQAIYGRRGVNFVHVLEGSEQSYNQEPGVYDPKGKVARQFAVGATPAAVIVDASGEIVYAGCYNRARFCDDHDTAFVDLALKAITSGKRPTIDRTPFYGCSVPH